MKLWLISQSVNDDYDTYDSAVVAAETEDAARNTYPADDEEDGWPYTLGTYSSWALPADVQVKYLGEAAENTKAGVICASFNAG